MANQSLDNSIIVNAKTLPELAKIATLEHGGDSLFAVRKFGYSASLTANVEEDVWSYGGTWVPQTTARTYSVVSSSTNDTLNGTGAWYVQILGIGANWELQNETVTLSGTTPVVTTQTFLRVNRARILYSGSNKINAGNITITATTDNTVQGYIQADHGISQSTHLTIPNGYFGITMDTNLTVFRAAGGSGAKAAECNLHVWSPEANSFYETITYGVRNEGGAYNGSTQLFTATAGKNTIFYRATAESTGTIVTASIGYLIIKGNYDNRSEF